MIYSMTGFGRGEVQVENKVFSVEGKTVNHRYLDINIRMPKRYIYMEEILRKRIKESINRGKVDLFINIETVGETEGEVVMDLNLAKDYHAALEKIGAALHLQNEVSALQISRFPEVISLKSKEENEELVEKGLTEGIEEALEQIMSMREQEGLRTKEDLKDRLKEVEEAWKVIEGFAPRQIESYRERLTERIKELTENGMEIDEDRIHSEVVYFADKSNINEELVRLKSHTQQFLQSMEKTEPMGRKLDFLIQEMNREINTISSKSHTVEISNEVVTLKSALEKMREQVQNIE